MNAARCPHCPYYKMGQGSFACFIWWNTPKLWANSDDPGPAWVGKYAAFGMAVLTLFPVYWLFREWQLLLIYFLGIGGLVLSIGIHECSRCLNFQCGHCTVPDDLRQEYLSSLS